MDAAKILTLWNQIGVLQMHILQAVGAAMDEAHGLSQQLSRTQSENAQLKAEIEELKAARAKPEEQTKE